MQFMQAEKVKTFLRLFISGPTGTGKTFSSLKIANGIKSKTGGNIGLIDTEHKKSTLNADWVKFDVSNIVAPYRVEDYIEAIHLAASKNYNILIIDSTSHAWNNILSRINEIVEINKKENFRAWGKKGEGTDLQNYFVETLLTYPGHLICTCRAKMDYAMKNVNGKMVVVKMGVGNIQRDGIEYEFDIIMDATDDSIDNHEFHISKDRTGKYQSSDIVPDEEFGVQLYEWLMSPDKEIVVEDFPEIKSVKSNIVNALSFFEEKEGLKIVDNVLGKNVSFDECRDILKLNELLDTLRKEYIARNQK